MIGLGVIIYILMHHAMSMHSPALPYSVKNCCHFKNDNNFVCENSKIVKIILHLFVVPLY